MSVLFMLIIFNVVVIIWIQIFFMHFCLDLQDIINTVKDDSEIIVVNGDL